jgi:hypothetical protein
LLAAEGWFLRSTDSDVRMITGSARFGIAVSVRCDPGFSATPQAVFSKQDTVVKMLLDHGAVFNEPNININV